MQRPNIKPAKPYMFPSAVLLSMATSIHKFNIVMRSSTVGQVRIVTATNNLKQCVLQYRTRKLKVIESLACCVNYLSKRSRRNC